MAKITNVKKEKVVEPKVPEKEAVDVSGILERLDKLEEENRKLKDEKKTTMQKAKEINDDPRKFSYKLW